MYNHHWKVKARKHVKYQEGTLPAAILHEIAAGNTGVSNDAN